MLFLIERTSGIKNQTVNYFCTRCCRYHDGRQKDQKIYFFHKQSNAQGLSFVSGKDRIQNGRLQDNRIR